MTTGSDPGSPVLAEFARRLEKDLAAPRRRQLSAVHRSGGKREDGQDERRRFLAWDWLVRTWLATWLDLDESSRPGATLAALDPITDGAGVRRAVDAVTAAGTDVDRRDAAFRLDYRMNRSTFEDNATQAVRQTALLAVTSVLWYLFPDATLVIDPPPPPPRPDDVWTSGDAAAWAVVPPSVDRQLPRHVLAQIAEKHVQRALVFRAEHTARTASRAWEDAWATVQDPAGARDAAREAVRPRRRDPSVWFVSEAAPRPAPRGLRRWREDRRRATAPPDVRADAVFDAVLDDLHGHLSPTISTLQGSAVDLASAMARLGE